MFKYLKKVMMKIDFLQISSNLRALKFNIDSFSKDKVKFIARKIVPYSNNFPKFLRAKPFFLIHQPKKVFKYRYYYPFNK